jgi:hypothetical protein
LIADQGEILLHPEPDELIWKFFILSAISSAVERLLHTQEVTGSNPVSRTMA